MSLSTELKHLTTPWGKRNLRSPVKDDNLFQEDNLDAEFAFGLNHSVLQFLTWFS